LPGLNEGQADHDNLRAALATLIERQETEAAQQLAGALGLFWYHRGFWSEGRRWLEQALALPGTASPPVAARALCRLGLLATAQADNDRATSALDAGFAVAQASGDEATMANIRLIRGDMAADAGDFEAALAELQEAGVFYNELGESAWLVQIGMSLGVAAAGLGDDDAAEAHFVAALANARANDEDWGEAVVLALVGRLHGDRRQFDEAAACFRPAFAVLRDLDCVYDLRRFMPDVANAATARGEANRAARLLGAVAAADAHFGFRPTPVERDRLERARAATQAILGNETLATAWEAGQGMSWSDLVAETVRLVAEPNESAALVPTDRATSERGAMLSPRERDVLRLIVAGRTDREIAAELSLSYRTVTSYVHNLLTKLDVSSRTAAAAYAIRHDFA
jgi:non-specific serine/threonine protein kinase